MLEVVKKAAKVEQLWFEGMEDDEERIDLDKFDEDGEPVTAPAENSVQVTPTADHSANTLRAIEGDWKCFTEWCSTVRPEISPLPCTVKAVNTYVRLQLDAGRKTSTIARRLNTIKLKHKQAGLPCPVTKKAMDKLRKWRREVAEESEAKAAFTAEQLCEISRKLSREDAVDIRDRAIVLVGVSIACRRSELVAYDLADLAFEKQGASLFLKKSKVDQEHKGRFIGIFPSNNPDLCPLRALKAWLEVRSNWPGPLFSQLHACRAAPRVVTVLKKRLGSHVVNRVVKNCARMIGLDSSKYGGHTLRATCVTCSLDSGASESQIIRVTGHANVLMLKRYHRPASVFAYNIMERVL